MTIFIFLFGSAIGSFLNVLIDRLSENQSIMGRSHCDFCGKKLTWFDLVPIFSFLTLGGKSRCCHKKLSWQYPLVELTTGIAFVLIFKDSLVFKTVFIAGIVSCFIVIFVSDFKYHLISDWILWALFGFSLLFKVLTPISSVFPSQAGIHVLSQIVSDVLSGLIVAAPIFLIYFVTRERAMGLGDVLLSAITGFLLGWPMGFVAIYIAFVTGAIYGIVLLAIHRKKLKSHIAFGPFIIIGALVMLYYGKEIISVVEKIY